MIGYMPPFDVPSSNGVPAVIAQTMRAVPLHDLDAMEAALRPGDVAAVILEADGAAGGHGAGRRRGTWRRCAS